MACRDKMHELKPWNEYEEALNDDPKGAREYVASLLEPTAAMSYRITRRTEGGRPSVLHDPRRNLAGNRNQRTASVAAHELGAVHKSFRSAC